MTKSKYKLLLTSKIENIIKVSVVDNKSIIIIILIIIAIAIASFGGYFILFNNENTQTMAFEEFTIEVPKNVEFQTSVSNIHMINSSEGYYVAELGRNTSISEQMFKNIASKNQDIGNIDGFNVENASGLHVYKMTQPMGNTKYIATYNLNGVAILIGAPDLDSLKSMVNSIKFTNITIEDDNTSNQPTIQVVKKSSSSNSNSDSNTSKEEENQLTDEDLANAYIYGYTDGYNDGNYYYYEYSDDYSYSDSGSSSSSSSDSSSGELESG